MQQSEAGRLINLIIQFTEKLQSLLPKRYRPFVKGIGNGNLLSKSIDRVRPLLTKEIILFRLGLQAKSAKAIQVSLHYLNVNCSPTALPATGFHRYFSPQLHECFQIEEEQIRTVQIKPQHQIRWQILRLIQPLIHFKSEGVNSQLIRLTQHLLSEPILPLMLELIRQIKRPQPLLQRSISLWFNQHCIVFEDVYAYRQDQIQSFTRIKHEHLKEHINRAVEEHKRMKNLISRYFDEFMAMVEGDGGRFGSCVMCGKPAEHYCKFTKASLCSEECGNHHLVLAQRHYDRNIQEIALKPLLIEGYKQLFLMAALTPSPQILTVITQILQQPSLFLLACPSFSTLFHTHMFDVYSGSLTLPTGYEPIYDVVALIAVFWLCQGLDIVQHFFQDTLLPVLRNKKPNFKLLTLTLRCLDKIYSNGGALLQLYVNFDCEPNRINVVQETLFQITKLVQDKTLPTLNKQDKLTLKNTSLQVITAAVQGLNTFNKQHPPTFIEGRGIKLLHNRQSPLNKVQDSSEQQPKNKMESVQIMEEQPFQAESKLVIQRRNVKRNLVQFKQKFNQQWNQGVKALFNLRIAQLDNDEAVVATLIGLRGLRKTQLHQFLFRSHEGRYSIPFLNRILNQIHDLPQAYIALTRYLPLEMDLLLVARWWVTRLHKDSTVKLRNQQQINLQTTKKEDTETTSQQQNCPLAQQKPKGESTEIQESVQWTYGELKRLAELLSSLKPVSGEVASERMPKLRVDRKELTGLPLQQYFTYCPNGAFIKTMQTQLSLFQIMLSYLLATDTESALNIINELIQVCPSTPWLTLVVKHCVLDSPISANTIRLSVGIVRLTRLHSALIREWIPVIAFIRELHFNLREEFRGVLTVNDVEEVLLEASQQSNETFPLLLCSTLFCCRDELGRLSTTFLLQKSFEMLSLGGNKTVRGFWQVLPELNRLCQLQLKPQLKLQLADRLKQFVAKAVKRGRPNQLVYTGEMIEALLELFRQFKDTSEVNDFVVKSLSTTLLHHYDLPLPAWPTLVSLMQFYASDCPQQVLGLMTTLIAQKLKHCLFLGRQLIEVCTTLLRFQAPTAQTLHSIQFIVQMLLNSMFRRNETHNSKEQKELQLKQDEIQSLQTSKETKTIDNKQLFENARKLLLWTVQQLSMLNGLPSFVEVMETSVLLMWMNQGQQQILSDFDLSSVFRRLFSSITESQHTAAVLSLIMRSCVAHNYHGIFKDLQLLMNSSLALSAVQSMKVYLQHYPLNPCVYPSLNAILLHFRIPAELLNTERLDLVSIDEKKCLEMGAFIHGTRLQRAVVDVLPFNSEFVPTLKTLLTQCVKFNQNLVGRCRVWIGGLSTKGTPPQLLRLEESIGVKLLFLLGNTQKSAEGDGVSDVAGGDGGSGETQQSIEEDKQLFQFCRQTLERYNRYRERLMLVLHSTSWEQQMEGIQLKRQSDMLMKLILQMLPKMNRLCNIKGRKKTLIDRLLHITQFVEDRTPILNSIQAMIVH